MDHNISFPKKIYGFEAIKFIARRYNTSPEKIVERFLIQTGEIHLPDNSSESFTLSPNEIALISDLRH
ncbi:MAG: hypothetical protein K2K58_07300 [Muribaculaceae bacterium]|nr:hypothetical protein [Muribaculaceae bacterium]